MKRKTHVLVISATNPVKRRARAGFKFTADPRAVMVTTERKLALMADSDLKIYKPKSDHFLRATGKEEMPNSIAKKMNDGLMKLHTTAIATPDYLRSEDSIRNELDMMGEDGVATVAKELGVKKEKDRELIDSLTEKLLEIEQEPIEVDPVDEIQEEEEEETEDDEFEGMNTKQMKKFAKENDIDLEDAETEDEIRAALRASAETGEATDDEAVEERKKLVVNRFKELDAMTEDELKDALEELGYENEGDKAGKILAVLSEEFGEDVEDMELPKVTGAGEETEDGETDDGKGTESDDEEKTEETEPKKKNTAQKGKEKPAAKKTVKKVGKKK